MKTEFKDIDEKYDLEIEKIVDSVKKEKAKKVLLQFPEGLKPYSQAICDEIEYRLLEKDGDKKELDCECLIWMGTCFGACDVPLEVENIGIDLIVQFGHSAWDYSGKKEIKVVLNN